MTGWRSVCPLSIWSGLYLDPPLHLVSGMVSHVGPLIGLSWLARIDVLTELRGFLRWPLLPFLLIHRADVVTFIWLGLYPAWEFTSLTSGPSAMCHVQVPSHQIPHTGLLWFERPYIDPWYLSFGIEYLIESPMFFFTMHCLVYHFIILCYIPAAQTKTRS